MNGHLEEKKGSKTDHDSAKSDTDQVLQSLKEIDKILDQLIYQGEVSNTNDDISFLESVPGFLK